MDFCFLVNLHEGTHFLLQGLPDIAWVSYIPMPVNIGQPSHGRFTKWHEAPVARAVFGVNNLHPRNMPAGALNDSFGCFDLHLWPQSKLHAWRGAPRSGMVGHEPLFRPELPATSMIQRVSIEGLCTKSALRAEALTAYQV